MSVSIRHDATDCPTALSENSTLEPATTEFDSRVVDDLDRCIVSLCSKINAATYELLVLIREFDERFGWKKWGLSNCREWLQWRCDISASTAREKVRVAHALKTLPAIAASFKTGQLSYSKVRALTRIARPEDEAQLVNMALKMSAAHVEQHCQQRRYAKADSIVDARSAQQNRCLRYWRDEARGTMTITIELPLEEGELIAKAVDKAALSLDTPTDAPGDESPWSAVQADAALAMAKSYLAGAADEQLETLKQRHSSADHYQVMIHVDRAALTDHEGTSQIPIDSAKRICCDASLIAIVEGEDGESLGMGRKQRTITTAIRRALWARDKGCAYPGCSHTRFVDAHHIQHWAAGGETSLENLVLLCSKHHKFVHEGGYRIHKNVQGQNVFTRPDGRAVPLCGYRIDDWQDDYSDNVPVASSRFSSASAEAPEMREQQGAYVVDYCKSDMWTTHTRVAAHRPLRHISPAINPKHLPRHVP